MKKNKWLLMLAAITLLATCLFAGLAMADDAGSGNADVPNSYYVMTPSGEGTVTLNFDGDPRTDPAYAPFISGGAYMNLKNQVQEANTAYYAGQITMNVVTTDPKFIKGPKGDVKEVEISVRKNNNELVADDLYFDVKSSDPRVIFVLGGGNKVAAADLATASNKFALNFMTTDEMIGELFNENQVITNHGGAMLPGTSTITVTAFVKDGKDDQGKDKYKELGSGSFKINVKVVTWDKVEYKANTTMVHKDEAGNNVIYLSELMDNVPFDQDTGYYFPIVTDNIGRGLGKFEIQPYVATYKGLHFEIDNTEVANITADFKDIVIKETGEFTLTVSDPDGYTTKAGKGPWKFKFIVKKEALTGYPIQSVNFTYDKFNREVGEYLDLNKYVYMMRMDQLGQHMTKGTIFKQVLKHGSGSSVFAKDAKYAKTYSTIWQEEYFDGGWGTNYPYVNERQEKFSIEWSSSNPKVAVVLNKKDLYKDTSSQDVWINWDPSNIGLDIDQWVGYIPSASGKRVTWYSITDKKYILPNQGYVLMKSPGTAIITVKVSDQGSGATYTASTKITVKGEVTPEPVVLIKRLKLNFKHSPMVMYVGDKQNISDDIGFVPNNATNKVLTFTSSNKKIVKVSKDGTLTAKKPGKATITISTTDGSGVSKSFKVEVLEK